MILPRLLAFVRLAPAALLLALPGAVAEERVVVSCEAVLAAKQPRVVKVPFNLEEVRQIQRSFDEGHQPWRGDPLSVAYVHVRNDLEPDVELENLKVAREGTTEAVVSGDGRRCWYRVHLKTLVKGSRGASGHWTAIRLEYGPRE